MAQHFNSQKPLDLCDRKYLHSLGVRGWVNLPNFLPLDLTRRLYLEASQSSNSHIAGIGSAGHTNQDIRRDRTIWFDGKTPAQKQYLELMEQIRLQVNEHFFAGLFEYEAHFAHYPKDAYYRKHRDALKGSSARVLTSVCYINENWNSSDGGELVIYDDAENQKLAYIEPNGGSLVLFWSEEFPHDVLPASRDRFSVAGWFRRNTESTNPL